MCEKGSRLVVSLRLVPRIIYLIADTNPFDLFAQGYVLEHNHYHLPLRESERKFIEFNFFSRLHHVNDSSVSAKMMTASGQSILRIPCAKVSVDLLRFKGKLRLALEI